MSMLVSITTDPGCPATVWHAHFRVRATLLCAVTRFPTGERRVFDGTRYRRLLQARRGSHPACGPERDVQASYGKAVRRLHGIPRLMAALSVLFGAELARADDQAAAFTTPEVPQLDGRLDEPVWSTAQSIEPLRQVSPQPGAEPSVPTQIRVLHDARMLYIGIVAFERDGEARIARQTSRDADLEGDDHVSIVIDPSGGGRNGYVFRINANGAQQDSLIYDGGEEREDWDAIWQAEVHREPGFWSAEIAIPLSALSGAGTGDWGFNVERYRAASGERLRWHGTQPDRYVGSLRDAGRLPGMADVAAADGHGLRIKPSLRLARSKPAGEKSDTQLEPGIDLFWRLRPDTMATLTLNTDFADTEVDDREVNLTRFPLFLPEKREFFLQDAGVFAFGGLQENALPFFSRRIGLSDDGMPLTLDGGLKLTHESRNLEAGLLAVRVDDADALNSAEVGVGRVAVRVGEHGRLGAIGTVGNPQGSDGSSLWGLDWQYRNSRFTERHALAVNVWTQSSRNDGVGTGYAHGAYLDWSNLGVVGNLGLARLDSDYAPALGFVAETGVEKAYGELGYWWRTAAGGDVIPQIDWEVSRGIDDARRYELLNPEIFIGNAGGDFVMPELYLERERLLEDFEIVPGLVIPAGDYRYDSVIIFAGIGARSLISGDASLRFGEFYDGDREDLTLEGSVRPSAFWGVSLRGGHTRLDLPGGKARVNLAALGLELTPGPRLAASTLVQWDDISEEIGVNLRLRWTVAPGRDIFLSINRLFQDRRGLATIASEESLKLAWNWQW